MSTIGTLVHAEHFLRATVPIVPLAILVAALLLFLFSKTSKEREKFKKISYLIFGIGIAFLIVGFLLSAGVTTMLDAGKPHEEPSAPLSLSDCEKAKDQLDKDMCYNKVAEFQKDASLCENIQSASQKDGCYFDAAIPTGPYGVYKDPSNCERIQNQTTREVCLAITRQDPSKCEDFDTAFKDFCYWHIGMARQDLSICDKTNSSLFKESCYTLVAYHKKDPSICDNLQVELGWGRTFKYACYTGVAEATEDPSICEGINDDSLRDNCYQLAR
jgi:hypothetical protein